MYVVGKNPYYNHFIFQVDTKRSGKGDGYIEKDDVPPLGYIPKTPNRLSSYRALRSKNPPDNQLQWLEKLRNETSSIRPAFQNSVNSDKSPTRIRIQRVRGKQDNERVQTTTTERSSYTRGITTEPTTSPTKIQSVRVTEQSTYTPQRNT